MGEQKKDRCPPSAVSWHQQCSHTPQLAQAAHDGLVPVRQVLVGALKPTTLVILMPAFSDAGLPSGPCRDACGAYGPSSSGPLSLSPSQVTSSPPRVGASRVAGCSGPWGSRPMWYPR